MNTERDEIVHGLRMACVAVVSAIVTATVVIGAGNYLLSRSMPTQDAAADQPLLIHTAG